MDGELAAVIYADLDTTFDKYAYSRDTQLIGSWVCRLNIKEVILHFLWRIDILSTSREMVLR